MNKITAKAVVSTKQEWGTGDLRSTSLGLTADYQDGRNKEWSAATPSFVLNMTVKGEIGDLINLGDKVDVTLTVNPEPLSTSETSEVDL